MAYHLISIGISTYASPGNDLSYPDQDAGEISAILRHSLGQGLTYDVLLRDSEATQIGVRGALNDKRLKTAQAQDTLLVFYSGHGAIGLNSEGKPEAYLAPHDAQGDIAISGISTTEVHNLLEDLPHENKIILLDCCYSGGANAKSLSKTKYKDLTNLKAFQNQSYAKGTFVFTACKEDEKAIESDDLKHGLFTYYLIEELVKSRPGETIPLSAIHDPVDKAVEAAAKQYHHTQTPTLKFESAGSMSIPKLTRPPELKPELIKIPTSSRVRPSVVPAPLISITDKKARELVEASIALVENATKSKLEKIAFRSTLGKELGTVKDAYVKQPKQIPTYEAIGDEIAKLEASSYQLFVMAAAVAMAGNDEIQKVYSEKVSELVIWKRGQSGQVAAIETPDVILLGVIYILFVCCIHTDDYAPIGKLLNTHVTDIYRGSFTPILARHEIHYADALGGNAKTVLSHIIDLVKSQKWLLELLAVDEDEIMALTLQANLCLCVATSYKDETFYPGYNDYELANLAPLINHIRSDSATQASMGSALFGAKGTEVPGIFANEVAKLNQAAGRGTHWWSYLKPEAFTSDEGVSFE